MKKKVFAFTLACMLTLSSVSVFAKSVSSPEPELEISISIGGKTVSKDDTSGNKVTGGKVNFEVVGEVEEDGETYQKIEFSAQPDGNNAFFKWEIDGDYKIVEGDLNSGKIVLIVYDDIEINALFKDENGNIVTDGPKDVSSTSPKTGVAVATGALLITMLGSGAVAVTTRRKFED